ncbi:MAG: hypothetical protein H7833_21420, partial [Magnetococcus sp. DMHC-1]
MQLGHYKSYVNLGYLSQQGIPGHPKNLEKALALYLDGVEKGDPRAYVALGLYYRYVNSYIFDLSRAYYWFQQGIEKNPNNDVAFAYAEAMRLVGDGTPAEPELAISRLKTAIRNGNMDAAAMLGCFASVEIRQFHLLVKLYMMAANRR